jgi:hypothetical protein
LGDLPLAPVEKLELCDRFDIELSWAEDAVTMLCKRERPLSLEEARQVGLKITVHIARHREERIQQALRIARDHADNIQWELDHARNREAMVHAELARTRIEFQQEPPKRVRPF